VHRDEEFERVAVEEGILRVLKIRKEIGGPDDEDKLKILFDKGQAL
jgi:hypothetical protein